LKYKAVLFGVSRYFLENISNRIHDTKLSVPRWIKAEITRKIADLPNLIKINASNKRYNRYLQSFTYEIICQNLPT
jgi:hypothetical protein